MTPKTCIPCDIVYDDCSDTAQHCVIVGRVEQGVLDQTLAVCKAGVLWLVDTEYSRGAHGNNLLIVPVEAISNEDFISVLMRFVFRVRGTLPGLRVSRSIEYVHAERYEKLGKQMKGLFLSAAAFMPTQRARETPASFHRQNRVLHNLKKLENALLPPAARGMFSRVPAVILGAGPSLDVSLPQLEAFQGRCLVFATDSTLGACMRYRIKPDFAVNIDPDKPAQKVWPMPLNIDRVLLSIQSTQDWFDRAIGSSWILPMGSLTEHWLESQGVALGARIAASNAGFTALAMADFFGCEPLILLGMDMAIGHEGSGSTHSSHIADTSHPEDVARVRESIPVRTIPGNYEKYVPTIFYPFYKELNAWLEKEHKEVVNINDRGGRLSGSICIHPDQMKSWMDEHLGTHLDSEAICALLNDIEKNASRTPSDCFLKKAVAAGEKGAHLLEPYRSGPRDEAWLEAVVHALRLVIQDRDIQGILGVYFMDCLASLAAQSLPDLPEAEQLFEQTLELLTIASRLHNA